jgi:acyl-CoA synthetase (NDP forming)
MANERTEAYGRTQGLEPFFNPASIAVVGASDAPGKISGVIMDNIAASGFKGRLYPVNPRHASVKGIECYPSISGIGAAIDLAIFAVPAAVVPGALKASAGGIRAAIVVSGGFSESGDDGRALEREIRDVARETGVRVIGPNCMGVYDAASGLDTFFIPRDRLKRPGLGRLAIVSQSGSFAVTAMDELAAEGVGVTKVVSYGNKADVNESDCLAYLAADAGTGAVAIYMESVEDGRRFVEAAGLCSRAKPVMAIKVGRTEAAASAIRSHTGALSGRHEVYRAAFRKAGVIEINGYEEFIAGCKALGMRASPGIRRGGNKVMIITDGGGMGVSIADACAEAGLRTPPLGEGVKAALKAAFPPYFAVGNPMDLTGSVTDGMFIEALERTMAGDSYDIAIIAALWGPPALTDSLAGSIAARGASLGKPLVICTPGGEYQRDKARLFTKEGLSVFTTPEGAARAASILVRASGRVLAGC